MDLRYYFAEGNEQADLPDWVPGDATHFNAKKLLAIKSGDDEVTMIRGESDKDWRAAGVGEFDTVHDAVKIYEYESSVMVF